MLIPFSNFDTTTSQTGSQSIYGSSQNGQPLVPASTLLQPQVADTQQSEGLAVAGNGNGTTHACSCICGCETASPAEDDDLECVVRQSLPIRSTVQGYCTNTLVYRDQN